MQIETVGTVQPGAQTVIGCVTTPANSRPSLRSPAAAGEQAPHPPAEVHRAYVASDPPEELKPDDAFGQPAPATTVALGVVTAKPAQPLDMVIGTAEGQPLAVQVRVVLARHPPGDLRRNPFSAGDRKSVV